MTYLFYLSWTWMALRICEVPRAWWCWSRWCALRAGNWGGMPGVKILPDEIMQREWNNVIASNANVLGEWKEREEEIQEEGDKSGRWYTLWSKNSVSASEGVGICLLTDYSLREVFCVRVLHCRREVNAIERGCVPEINLTCFGFRWFIKSGP